MAGLLILLIEVIDVINILPKPPWPSQERFKVWSVWFTLYGLGYGIINDKSMELIKVFFFSVACGAFQSLGALNPVHAGFGLNVADKMRLHISLAEDKV